MYRHGDVLLIPVEEIPATAKAVKPNGNRVELAFGEVSGHAHVTSSRKSALHEDGKDRFLSTPTGVSLRHVDLSNSLTHEHATLKLPAGNYRVVRQEEKTPDGWRQVSD